MLNRLLRMCKNGNFFTYGQIFNCKLTKFEISVARLLFDYEIWWHLQQDLCMFGAISVAVVALCWH